MKDPCEKTIVALSALSFFGGVAKSVTKNQNVFTNQHLDDAAFLMTITTLKDTGILKILLGSGLVTVGAMGLFASFFFGVGWAVSASNNPSTLSKFSWLASVLTGGAASASAIGYGCYKAGEGVGEIAVSMAATMNRRG